MAINESSGPFNFDLFEKMRAFRQERTAMLDNAARIGDAATLSYYWRSHEGSRHVEAEKNTLLAKMISTPQSYTSKHTVLDSITDKGFDFAALFAAHENLNEKKIFALYETEAKAETARFAAVLLAEYIKVQLMADMHYSLNIGQILETSIAGLKGAKDIADKKNAVLAVQNALVDYVHDNGGKLPLNRGAAMLRFCEADMRAAGNSNMADFYSKKITDFKERRVESLKYGEMLKLSPVFAP